MNENMQYLPQLQAQVTIANNSDWRDVMFLPMPDGTTPIDLTGMVFQLTVRETVDSTVVALQLTTIDGTLINGGDDGTITFAAPALMLLNQLAPGSYVFDLIARDEEGTTINLFAVTVGQLTVNQGVTRDLNEVMVDYLSWLVPSLQTEPPEDPGVLWNNNGVMCISGLRESLPVSVPTIQGKLWNNGGVICISTGSATLPAVRPADTGLLWNDHGVVSLT